MRIVGVVVYLASFAGAIDLAQTSPAIGVVLGVPAFILLLYCIYMILRGSPQVDQLATERLVDALKHLEGHEEVSVVVRDQMPSGMVIRRGTPPTLIAALSFMGENDDDVLRGAAALRLSELDSERFARRSSLETRGYVALCLAVGVMAGVLLPGISILVIAAPVGLLCWLIAAGFGAWTHRPSLARIYAPLDEAAVRRVGDPATVQRALRALAQWRIQAYSRRDPVGRVLFRCIQPIRPTGQELTRATGLE
jgi:hypothetical protein